MATSQQLQQAMQKAQQNPSSPFATELRKRIEAGNFDSQLQELGVNVPSIRETGGEKDFSPIKSLSRGLNMVFGGEKIGEAIGTFAARSGLTGLSEEERQFVSDGPSVKEIAGDIGVAATTLFPTARLARFAQPVLKTLGIGQRATKPVSQAVSGAATGASADITRQIAEDREIEPGLGTLVGGGFPLVGPVSRAVAKTGARVATDVSGALTGTGGDVLEQAFISRMKGGESSKQFAEAIRGQITPEQIVQNTRNSIQQISANRQRIFAETLEEIGEETVNTQGLTKTFEESLSDFGIKVKGNALDFSGSKLRTVPAAQSKLQNAYDELRKLPENATIKEIDTSRQALGVLRTAGDDPSANAANKLIDDAQRAVRGYGENVPGYGQMLDQFAESSQFLDEIERGLSAGDRSTVDQAYRRIVSVLRVNNEQRAELVRQLDEMSGGTLTSQIAGQQLQEVLPRGIFRQIIASLALGSAAFGGVGGVGLSAGYLPALVFASPRVTGELVGTLGLGAGKAKIVTDAINTARNTLADVYGVAPENLIKAVGIGGAINESGNEEDK